MNTNIRHTLILQVLTRDMWKRRVKPHHHLVGSDNDTQQFIMETARGREVAWTHLYLGPKQYISKCEEYFTSDKYAERTFHRIGPWAALVY